MFASPVIELPRHVVDLLLQYLLPPTPPLPSHLLSNALRQRHYFLDITPASDPSEYFLWPRGPPGATDARAEQSAIVTELDQFASEVDITQLAGGYEISVEYEVVQDVLQGRFPLPSLALRVVCVFEVAAPLPGMDSPTKDTQPEWRYHDVIWNSARPKWFATPTAALAAAETPQDIPGDVEDAGVQNNAADFWDGWSSSSDGAPAIDKAQLTQEQQDKEDLEYLERHETVQNVIDENDSGLWSPSRAIGSSSLMPGDLSTAGATPDGPNSNKYGALSESARSPGEKHDNTSLSRADDAAMKIIQGAYTLWESSETNMLSTANEKTKKLAFMSLVERALSA